jgi:general secretion pathway protein J
VKRGFTLIELMCALVILSLLALMSFRGLAAVIDSRERVAQETGKWRSASGFFARLQRDVQLSAPRPVRAGAQRFEFTRLAAAEGREAPQRIAYLLNESREIELWLWSAPEGASGGVPTRHVVLSGVAELELRYLDARLAWAESWPLSGPDPLPRALKVRLVLASGEELVRVFSLR